MTPEFHLLGREEGKYGYFQWVLLKQFIESHSWF